MREIKKAFKKVKKDIFTLGDEIQDLRKEILDIKKELKNTTNFIDKVRKNRIKSASKIPTHNTTHDEKIPTQIRHTTQGSQEEPLKKQYMGVSTRNQGVPTDRQTDRQTDERHIKKYVERVSDNDSNFRNFQEKTTQDLQKNQEKQDKISQLDKASEILSNLDNLKKELRLKIKKLTSQEMRVFSLIYQLNQQGLEADYKTLASKMDLSEGSIRDYIYKIIKKGIKIQKQKAGNKKINLQIPSNLKKIASLDTILKLREM